jgi:CRISPR-associated endonuclease/helicase Cas3
VIALDEVQALLDALLPPLLSAHRHLSEYFGATMLLASATQPAFFDLGPF